MKMHHRAFDLFQAWYNFIKPHKSLRLKIDSGNRKWFQRTPAMAEGITDHIWSLKELLTFRVPVQWFGDTTELFPSPKFQDQQVGDSVFLSIRNKKNIIPSISVTDIVFDYYLGNRIIELFPKWKLEVIF